MQDLPDPTQVAPIVQSANSNPTDTTVSSVATNDLPLNQGSPVTPNDQIGQMQKEAEPIAKSESQTMEEMMPEMNILPELTDIGVEKISDQVVLPPDLKKSGVEAIGPSQPVSNLSDVKLPISDDLVMSAKNAKIMSSFFWLYMWCVKQLKRAHLHLKNVGGKVVRVKE